MQSSLLKFFSPGLKKNDSCNNSLIEDEKENANPKASIKAEDDDSGEIIIRKPKKRVIMSDSSDEETRKPVNKLLKIKNDQLNDSTLNSSMNDSHCNNSMTLNETAIDQSVLNNPATVKEAFKHEEFDFLKPEKIRDANKRPLDHPDYDPTTLYVPQDFISKVTPGFRQWWEIKSQHYDTIIFFKVGKFYELYHMDAVIGVRYLKIAFMKGDYAHCGFPEKAFSGFANVLVNKGYKVARVEQTERPSEKASKVVRREICQILTPGTNIEDLRETMNEVICEEDFSCDPSLLALISEKLGPSQYRIGYAYLIPKTALILFGSFHDDGFFCKIKTLLSHANPRQVLFNKKTDSKDIHKVVQNSVHSCNFEYLIDESQFLPSRETIKLLDMRGYFNKLSENEQVDKSLPFYETKKTFPTSIYNSLDPTDSTGFSVKPDCDLAIRCLGALVFYLKSCLIDEEILSLGNIHLDSPSFTMPNKGQKFTVIDALTIKNLDLLRNSANGGSEGTLLEKLNLCTTPMGKRLIRRWIVSPLYQIEEIKARQEAVEDFLNLDAITNNNEIPKRFRKLPDLERLLTKIHMLGVNGSNEEHPESRAILFDELVYSKKKISDFSATIVGFNELVKIVSWLRTLEFQSQLLKRLISSEESGGDFPNLSEILDKYMNKFDHEKAKREGRIYPEPGLDSDYDASLERLQDIEKDLELHLQECSKEISCTLKFVGTGKNRYQIEVPDSKLKSVPMSWELSGQRKGFRRYKTTTSVKLFERIVKAEEAKSISLVSIMRRLFADFSSNYQYLHKALENIIEFDCLYALGMFSRNLDQNSCLPQFVLAEKGAKSILNLRDGYHPSLVMSSSEIVPNDILLNCEENPKSCYVVTGPNMGGKSTLMRQTALLSILAHMGCMVPASSFVLTPIDRIFTRIGASDKILTGESTFLVEMSEMGYILKHTTPQSLLLIDELGRGTSTFDGAAIASAVLKYLCKDSIESPRTIFSTHYHNMLEKITRDVTLMSNIRVGHMGCKSKDLEITDVETEVGVNTIEKVTFLYKLTDGVCPKSYGFNVALMAKLPSKIILNAITKAKELEKATETVILIKQIGK